MMTEIPFLSLWLDIETTGIEPERHKVLEVGLVVADGWLQPIASKSVVVDAGADLLLMGPDVLEMHTKNGLLDDIEARGLDPMLAALEIEAFAHRWMPTGEGPIIAGGSGIDRFDLPFLRRFAPGFTDLLHYRTIDVSGLKVLMHHGAGLTSERYYDRRATEGSDRLDDVPHRGVSDALDALYVARAACTLLWEGAR